MTLEEFVEWARSEVNVLAPEVDVGLLGPDVSMAAVGVDSMAMADLAARLEQHLGRIVAEEDLVDVDTLREFYDAVIV